LRRERTREQTEETISTIRRRQQTTTSLAETTRTRTIGEEEKEEVVMVASRREGEEEGGAKTTNAGRREDEEETRLETGPETIAAAVAVGVEERKDRDAGRAREIIAIMEEEAAAAGAEEVANANATTRETGVTINHERLPRKEKRIGEETKKRDELWKKNARWRRSIEILERVSRII
jgi:hypothetical protein